MIDMSKGINDDIILIQDMTRRDLRDQEVLTEMLQGSQKVISMNINLDFPSVLLQVVERKIQILVNFLIPEMTHTKETDEM